MHDHVGGGAVAQAAPRAPARAPGQPRVVDQARIQRAARLALLGCTILLGGFVSILGIAVLVAWIARVSRRLVMYADSTRAIAAKAPAALPAARVVVRDAPRS